MTEEAIQVFTALEGFTELDTKTIVTKRLGGLTNRNYEIDCPKGHYVLRIAGDGTGDYIDRKTELNNASVASRAGVNAEIIHFDVESGTMLCRYIEGAITMDIDKFRDQGSIARAGRAFNQLHQCGEMFTGRFELFDQIDQYLKVVNDLGADLPEGYADVQKDAEQVRAALSRHELPLAPCHCDPMVENCLDDGERMHIIDFEYAGNNDPMWDLGDLSVEGAFTDEQDLAFLNAYFSAEPSAFDHGRMVMYKGMCDLLWTLWGVVQHANNNPAEDFWAYATGRLERCGELMATGGFPRHLAAVNKGP